MQLQDQKLIYGESVLSLDDVYDSTSALEFMAGVKDMVAMGGAVSVTSMGLECRLSDLFYDPDVPLGGTKEKALAPGIKSIAVDRSEYIVTLTDKISHDAYQDFWERLGFETYTEKKSLLVVDPITSETIVKYWRIRISVPEKQLERYLHVMEDFGGD